MTRQHAQAAFTLINPNNCNASTEPHHADAMLLMYAIHP